MPQTEIDGFNIAELFNTTIEGIVIGSHNSLVLFLENGGIWQIQCPWCITTDELPESPKTLLSHDNAECPVMLRESIKGKRIVSLYDRPLQLSPNLDQTPLFPHAGATTIRLADRDISPDSQSNNGDIMRMVLHLLPMKNNVNWTLSQRQRGIELTCRQIDGASVLEVKAALGEYEPNRERQIWKIQPISPEHPPKYLAVWTEDYLFTVETNSKQQGYLIEKNRITVYYNPELPPGLFQTTMVHLVDHISYLLGLEAQYIAPPELRSLKPQPYNNGGFQLISPNMVGDPEDDCEDLDEFLDIAE
jgi:hypothetical protein